MSSASSPPLPPSSSFGFRPDMLEKTVRLVELLEAFSRQPMLCEALALKGGTALNLFVFDLPRLSVDIDLNYVGEEGLEAATVARQEIEALVTGIARRLGFNAQSPKTAHALTSWTLPYRRSGGGRDVVKVEINYLYRVPLFDLVRQDSPAATLLPKQATGVLLLDRHELAAGKLAALLARRTSRDLFDAHELLTKHSFDPEKLRSAFVAYGGMNIVDWRTVGVDDIDKAAQDLDTYLLPLLRDAAAQEVMANGGSAGWQERLLRECKEALAAAVLPLREGERAFLDQLLDEGEIKPELFTADTAFADKVRRHPALLWRARNVREFRGKA